eukprot:614282-Prorocentrum_minimum.AAC.1
MLGIISRTWPSSSSASKSGQICGISPDDTASWYSSFATIAPFEWKYTADPKVLPEGGKGKTRKIRCRPNQAALVEPRGNQASWEWIHKVVQGVSLAYMKGSGGGLDGANGGSRRGPGDGAHLAPAAAASAASAPSRPRQTSNMMLSVALVGRHSTSS